MGAGVRTFPDVMDKTKIEFAGLSITSAQLLILGTTLLLMLLLQFIVKKTKIGKAMRAVSVDADAARLMGINVDRTISYTFAIGSALAGAAGVLVGVYYRRHSRCDVRRFVHRCSRDDGRCILELFDQRCCRIHYFDLDLAD